MTPIRGVRATFGEKSRTTHGTSTKFPTKEDFPHDRATSARLGAAEKWQSGRSVTSPSILVFAPREGANVQKHQIANDRRAGDRRPARLRSRVRQACGI